MKMLRFVIFGIALLLLTACNAFQPPERNPKTLSLTLEMSQKEVRSIEDSQVQVTLSNQSDSSVLVHKRLHSLPYLVPPGRTELLILISDSSGKPIDNTLIKFDFHPPDEDTLGVLKPGEKIEKTIYLELGFDDFMFKKGEKYTIVAIYQNGLDITRTIEGVDVFSWIGSIRSNEETFVILPPGD
jgi:hypothetical protein